MGQAQHNLSRSGGEGPRVLHVLSKSTLSENMISTPSNEAGEIAHPPSSFTGGITARYPIFANCLE